MQRNKIVFVCVLVIGIVGGAYLLQRPSSPLTLGYISSLTGKYGDLGKTCRDGALLAVEEINASGGVDGRKLNLIIRDDSSVTNNAIGLSAELVEKNVAALVGPMTSAAAKAILPYINSQKLLTVGPVIAGDYMAGKDDYFIKLFPAAGRFGSSLAKVATEKYKLKKFVVMHDDQNNSYAGPILQSFEETAIANGATVDTIIQFNSLENSSYSDIVKDALQHDPDGILLVASALSAAEIVQLIRNSGSSAYVFSPPWALSQSLITNGGRAVEGMLFYTPYSQELDDEDHRAFKENYQARFSSEPTFCSAFNYDAIKLIAKAFEVAGESREDQIRDVVLEIGSFKGCQNEYTLDANGDAKTQLILQTVNNGKFVNVE